MPFDPEEVNRLLDLRVRDCASRRPADSLQDHLNRVRDDRPKLLRCLGLEPIPAAVISPILVAGTIERKGYRIEKIAYRSRPNFTVTAHLYLPENVAMAPLILRPHGHWPGKKSEPVVQASAIGLALSGYAVFVIDSPGDSGELADQNERAAQGPHNDPWLAMGRPHQGFYVWDMMCALDYLVTRPEIDGSKIGITGASGGGLATMLAFAVDERIKCAAPVCFASSLEAQPHNGCLCNHVPGILTIGDRADLLALRAPAPILLVGATNDPEFPAKGMQMSYEKLKSIYRRFDRESRIRLEMVESGHDYNRRMREVVLAFFDEHLKGEPRRTYKSEMRPITDGYLNPAPAETVESSNPELKVLSDEGGDEATMRSFLELAIESVTETPLDIGSGLVPWARYGRLGDYSTGRILELRDSELQLGKVDQRLLTYLGLGVCEMYAQLLHVMLPGGLPGWESSTLGPAGDVMSSLIGSMKTLVGSHAPQTSISEVVAEGPAASLIALFLHSFRPSLIINCSHEFTSWKELYDLQNPSLIQPLAIYYRWPWSEIGAIQVAGE